MRASTKVGPSLLPVKEVNITVYCSCNGSIRLLLIDAFTLSHLPLDMGRSEDVSSRSTRTTWPSDVKILIRESNFPSDVTIDHRLLKRRLYWSVGCMEVTLTHEFLVCCMSRGQGHVFLNEGLYDEAQWIAWSWCSRASGPDALKLHHIVWYIMLLLFNYHSHFVELILEMTVSSSLKNDGSSCRKQFYIIMVNDYHGDEHHLFQLIYSDTDSFSS